MHPKGAATILIIFYLSGEFGGNMETEKIYLINISIWGKFPEWHGKFPEDYLWHDAVSSLPEVGSILQIDDTAFQVEAICLDECDTKQQTYVVTVRPYTGTIPPTLVFSYLET